MKKNHKRNDVNKIAVENRKARFSYEIMTTLEAGIVLTGTEVKSLRKGQANIQESYASVEDRELWLINSFLPEYLEGNRFNHEPRRKRKLLVKKKERDRLACAIERHGMTMVPLKIYFNDKGFAKLLLAVAQGKKLHDKRETEKKRDWSRDKARLLKQK